MVSKEERQEAKADAAAAKARAKAARPFWRKKRFLIPLALLIIVVIAVASGGGDDGPSHPAEEDVAIESCDVDATTNWAAAKVAVTNHSSKASDYFITVQMETSDGQLWDTARASVTALGPDQSTIETAQSLKADAPTGLTCRVQDVNRIQTLSD